MSQSPMWGPPVALRPWALAQRESNPAYQQQFAMHQQGGPAPSPTLSPAVMLDVPFLLRSLCAVRAKLRADLACELRSESAP
jgi:hypothetical protein